MYSIIADQYKGQALGKLIIIYFNYFNDKFIMLKKIFKKVQELGQYPHLTPIEHVQIFINYVKFIINGKFSYKITIFYKLLIIADVKLLIIFLIRIIDKKENYQEKFGILCMQYLL